MHIVTHDDVLARPDFALHAEAMLERGGGAVALHVRAPATSGRSIAELADHLVRVAREHGATLVVNDRVDVALAVDAHGVHLGHRSAPPQRVRALVGPVRFVGASVHDTTEAGFAAAGGTDYLFMGTIYESVTHPGRTPIGTSGFAQIARAASLPVLAIGGVTPERVVEVLEGGGHGVAVIRGVWGAADPVAALDRYLEFLG